MVKISQISVLKIEIRNPNKNVAEVAFKKLIENYGGVFTNEVVDYYGIREKVDFGMRIGNKTIGIRISEKIEYLGDEFLLKDLFEKIKNDFNEIYIAMVISEALRSLGYNVRGTKMASGIYLEAER
ncbi:MAG: hypothetical protein NZ879_04615 [Archaeoglobaceae archaeon]|nr:hypothetical protein [Archaeoglobaceae archaeon]MDW8118246.1 hypothetical protein [Archaeoglobaceae archaeon]